MNIQWERGGDTGFITRSLFYRLVQDIESADVSSLCPKEPGGLYDLEKCGERGWKGPRKLSFMDLLSNLDPGRYGSQGPRALSSLRTPFSAPSSMAPSHI